MEQDQTSELCLSFAILIRFSCPRFQISTHRIQGQGGTGDAAWTTWAITTEEGEPWCPSLVVVQIKLSTKSFGGSDGSAEVAAGAFRAQAATLSDVDISDVIAGR